MNQLAIATPVDVAVTMRQIFQLATRDRGWASWPQVLLEKPANCAQHVLAALSADTVALFGHDEKVELLVCLDESIYHLHRIGEQAVAGADDKKELALEAPCEA